METKSRYEVMSELEAKKRDLIKERDGLKEQALAKEKNLKLLQRKKDDTILAFDRELADQTEDKKNFEAAMAETKVTIDELIKSVDDSLDRFNTLNKVAK